MHSKSRLDLMMVMFSMIYGAESVTKKTSKIPLISWGAWEKKPKIIFPARKSLSLRSRSFYLSFPESLDPNFKTSVRRIFLSNAMKKCRNEREIRDGKLTRKWFSMSRKMFSKRHLVTGCSSWFNLLAEAVDEHESLVFAERWRSALPTRFSSASSLADTMQAMF